MKKVAQMKTNKAAIIDIIQSDHTHRATVYDLKSLESYCSGLVIKRKPFRIGKIHSYGSVSIDGLVHTINRISRFGTYDKEMGK